MEKELPQGVNATHDCRGSVQRRASSGAQAPLPPLVPSAAAKPGKPALFMPAAARESTPQASSFAQPGSFVAARPGSPSPARIEAQQQQSPDEYLRQPSTADSGPENSPLVTGNGGGWPGGPRQGMGGRVGSFSQYLSPPVSNGTSQGPPSPPATAAVSRLGAPQPASAGCSEQQAGSAANGGSQAADLGGFVYAQTAETGHVAGSDYYTSYSAVLGVETMQQGTEAGSKAMHGGWESAPAQGQMDWAAQQYQMPSQGANAEGLPGAAQMVPAPDEMTDLEL